MAYVLGLVGGCLRSCVVVIVADLISGFGSWCGFWYWFCVCVDI